MVAGNIPGKTQTLALAIFHDSQIGRDDRALVLAGVTVVLAFGLSGSRSGSPAGAGGGSRRDPGPRRAAPAALHPAGRSRARAGGDRAHGPLGLRQDVAARVARGSSPEGARARDAGPRRAPGLRPRVSTLPPEARHVGYVPQDAGLFPHLTALGNVRFGRAATPPVRHRDRHAPDPAPCSTATRSPSPGARSSGSRWRERSPRGRGCCCSTSPWPRSTWRSASASSRTCCASATSWSSPASTSRTTWERPWRSPSVSSSCVTAPSSRRGGPIDLLSPPGVLREAESGIENLLTGRIAAHDEDRVSPGEFPATGFADRASRSRRSPGREHVSPSPSGPRTSSCRSSPCAGSPLATSIPPASRRWSARPADATLRCSVGEVVPAPVWLARVTPGAVEALGLAPASPVWLAVKSHSIRLV